jgi:hypothetical protein
LYASGLKVAIRPVSSAVRADTTVSQNFCLELKRILFLFLFLPYQKCSDGVLFFTGSTIGFEIIASMVAQLSISG